MAFRLEGQDADMQRDTTLDVLRDVLRELQELEEQLEWYTAGKLVAKIEQIIGELEHEHKKA